MSRVISPVSWNSDSMVIYYQVWIQAWVRHEFVACLYDGYMYDCLCMYVCIYIYAQICIHWLIYWGLHPLKVTETAVWGRVCDTPKGSNRLTWGVSLCFHFPRDCSTLIDPGVNLKFHSLAFTGISHLDWWCSDRTAAPAAPTPTTTTSVVPPATPVVPKVLLGGVP